MRTVHRSFSVTLLVAALAVAQQATAQTPNIRVAGRVQAHFSSSSGDSSANYNPNNVVSSAFEIRRLRIQADVRLGENINMVLQPSFEMGSLRMRDAYLRVLLARNETSSFGLTMGQEKKPFNRYTLTSSNNLPSIERGLRLRGLAAPVIAQNNLLEENGYIEHDLGASADVSLSGGRFILKAGVYNGSGESTVDVNGSKSFGGRATATILQDTALRPVLRIGAAVMSRDRGITTTATSTAFSPDSSRRTTAIGFDVEYGDFRPGLHLIGDFATGDALLGGAHCLNAAAAISCRFDAGRNFGGLRPGAPDSAFATFRSIQLVAAWRWQPDDEAGTRLIKIIEPALRVDFTDPNTSASSDQATLITPALNIYFSQGTVMRAGIDLYRYYDANGVKSSARALRISWQSNF